MEFVIYTDESDRSGAYFSNFYGGVLVRSPHLESVRRSIAERKLELGLIHEVKWSHVSEHYLRGYIALIDAFFDLVAADRIKVRVMFTNNTYVPQGLTADQRRTEYHRLYYQFVKHAFGLQYCDVEHAGTKRVRLNVDQMPTSREETARFKSFVLALNHNTELRRAQIQFDARQFAEICSRNHDLLQCLDIVLGSMAFKLNNKHLAKPEGKNRRGKRTLTKESLYRHIRARICQIYPNFNVGESTGIQGDPANRWRHPYRHWKLIPNEHERDLTRKKP